MGKICFVPNCANSSVTTPSKIFVSVPKNLDIRKKWFIAARRFMGPVPPKTSLYCCEDHFNLQDDMENYWQYQFQPTLVLLKKGVIPHKFDCQPGRHTYKTRPLSEQRARKRKVEEILSEAGSSSATEPYTFSGPEKEQLLEIADLSKPSCSKDVHSQEYSKPGCSKDVQPQEYSEEATVIQLETQNVSDEESWLEGSERIVSTRYKSLTTADVSVQTHKIHCRSKSVQVSLPVCKDVAVSPFQIEYVKKANVGAVKRKLQFEESDASLDQSSPTKLTPGKLSSDVWQPSTTSAGSDSDVNIKEEEKKLEQIQFRKKFVNILKSKLKFYTGVPDNCSGFITMLERKTKMPSEYIYLILMKIRTDDTFERLSDLFGISKTHASTIFNQNLDKLAVIMKPLIFWPSRESIKRNLPIQFRITFSNVQSIIDCLEIQIQKPSAAIDQSLTWSEYKKANTIKYLVSITPDGLINFVSQGYGGRTTDMKLLQESNFMECLPENCEVMADRGFKQIEGLLLQKKCKLIRPPNVEANTKMTKDDVIQTRRIASVRIHIERLIRRIREFYMLSPHATTDIRMVSKLDSVIIIACGIINLQSPIIQQ